MLMIVGQPDRCNAIQLENPEFIILLGLKQRTHRPLKNKMEKKSQHSRG